MKFTRYIFLIFSFIALGIIINKFPKYIEQEKFIKILFISCLFIFFILSIFFKKNLQRKKNIFFLIFIISIYLLNFLVGFHYYLTSTTYKNNKRYKELGIKFDHRDPAKFIKDSGDKNLFPLVTPSELMKKNKKIMVLSGMPKKKYIQCNEYGSYKEIITDEFGFNNLSNDLSFDILLAGDSFAHGVCVEQKKETHNLLNDNGYKTYTIGYSGNGPLLTLASLTEVKNYIDFDNIVWLFFRNDFYDISWESKNSNLIKYLNKDFKGIGYFNNLEKVTDYQKNYIINNLPTKKGFNYQESFFQLKFLNDYVNKVLHKYKNKKLIKYDQKIIEKVFDVFDYKFKNNRKIVIYLPNQKCFTKNKVKCDDEVFFLKSIFKETDIEFFDFREMFVDKNYKSFFGLELERTHYSNTGYKNLSNYIQRIMR